MRDMIIAEIMKVAQEQKIQLSPIADNQELLESGLDSLCFAILVARLEDQFGFDPFNSADEVIFPTTFGDFFKLYSKVPA